MAANLQQMAATGQLMPQQQQQQQNRPSGQELNALVFRSIQATHMNAPPGWQSSVPIAERLGKTVNLITSIILANPTVDWRKPLDHGVSFEREAFMSSPDKEQYESRMNMKNAEMFKKRQAQEGILRETMNAQSAAHAAQRQQMMINQQNASMMQAQMAARGMPPQSGGQQGFQHLQHPMQVSQLQQQPQQMSGMNMNNPMAPQMNPNQGFAMAGAGGQVMEAATRMAMNTSEPEKQRLRELVRNKLSPQQLQSMQAANRDPLIWYFQQQAAVQLKQQQQQHMLRQQMARQHQLQLQQQHQHQQQPPGQQQQQHPGMPHSSQAMQLQNSQQRQMNPTMMNAMGQPGGGPGGQIGPFGGSMESIMTEQQKGLMAQEQGQMVVPANPGPNRNTTPQPVGGVQPSGPNQTPRPSMQPAQMFNLQQAQMKMEQQAAAQSHAQAQAAQSAAQAKAQAQMRASKSLQGQPGGLGGLMPASQSPGMPMLNAPVRQPPVAMSQMDGSPMPPQGTPQFGGQGLDPRFNQQRTPGPMAGNNFGNDAADSMNAMISNLTPDQQQKFRNMPKEQVMELLMKFRANSLGHRAQQQPMMNRPGQPQPGQQFPPGNTGNQFGMPNGPQPMNPNAGLTPQQQQALVAQRMRMAAQDPRQLTMMDSMEFQHPVSSFISQIWPGSLPPDVKRWSHLKTWIGQQSQVPDNVRRNLIIMQQKQFHEMIANNRAGVAGPGGIQQPGAANMNHPANMPANFPAFPQGMIPPGMPAITDQDLANMRRNPKCANASDEQLRELVMRMKVEQYRKRAQASQNAANVGMNPQQPPNQQGQPAAPPAPVAEAAPAAQAGGHQGGAQGASVKQENLKQDNSVATSAPESTQPAAAAAKNNKNKPAPPKPSPAPPKNLKRPGTDDIEAPSQPSMQMQRPSLQPAQKPMGPSLTPEQIASLTPEQRTKYQIFMRQRQAQNQAQGQVQGQDIVQRLKAMSQQEIDSHRNQQWPEVVMTPAERNDLQPTIYRYATLASQIMGPPVGRWFFKYQDDNRARLFFKGRLRLCSQFHDEKQLQGLKDPLTISAAEVNTYKQVIESVMAEIQATKPQSQNGGHPAAAAGQPSAQQNQAATSQPPQPTAAPAPLNEANLVKNNAALNKIHQRSNSKSGPPAAPTSSQPPFSFGATSPDGKPLYSGQPALTQDKLQMPPVPRKKTKTGAQQTSSPATFAQNPSPQIKQVSPEVKKQETKQQDQPKFRCKEIDCEMHSVGFPTQQSCDAHYQAEHVKPYQDPMGYTNQILASALGLDAEGHSKVPVTSAGQDGAQPAAQPMDVTHPKQGQTPSGKMESAATPMSRGASMNRQVSTTGGLNIKMESPARLPISLPPQEMQQPRVADNAWAGSTIDPQSLMQTTNLFDPAAGGVVADMSLYRSFTPNDTPESSKDSHASEPNSDIADTANIDIDINWQPMEDPNLMVGMEGFNMDGGFDNDYAMSNDYYNSTAFDITDDMLVDLNKPFTFDSSLYKLHTT